MESCLHMTAACPHTRKLPYHPHMHFSLEFIFVQSSCGKSKRASDPSSFPRVPLERDNSEEFLKREARAAQLAEEIEASAAYKARVALENDERTEEEKYTAVVRGEREAHTLSR